MKLSQWAIFAIMSLGLLWSLIFSALKFAGVIDWSWFYITLPGTLVAVVVALAVIYVTIKLSGRDE